MSKNQKPNSISEDEGFVLSQLSMQQLIHSPSRLVMEEFDRLDRIIDRNPDWMEARTGLSCRLFQRLEQAHVDAPDRQKILNLFKKNIVVIAGSSKNKARSNSLRAIDDIVSIEVFFMTSRELKRSAEFYAAVDCFAKVSSKRSMTRSALQDAVKQGFVLKT